MGVKATKGILCARSGFFRVKGNQEKAEIFHLSCTRDLRL
ncbi:hypothetical protein B4096_0061 [Heyndrickxia coagulans]|nr:hypothetical protein B4100_0108 [Heyndrickxia coagulans]KYC90397.1 hypothetical protein B4096_0061 [Heyndrickxia coagulans]